MGAQAPHVEDRYLRVVFRTRSNHGGLRRVGWLAALWVAIVLGATPGPSWAKQRADDSLESWHEGPVRYLITRTETKLYRQLKTAAERLEFVRRFWDRRDPQPQTPINEFRVMFWQRVIEANRMFRDTTTPGWKTDRGKIYVLLGPPTEINQNQEFDTGFKNVTQRGLQRWHYQGLRNSPSADFIIAFYRDGDGAWRLTDDPKLNARSLDLTRGRVDPGLNSAYTRLFDQLPAGSSRLGIAMDLASVQAVPDETELMRTIVQAEEFVGAFPAQLVAHPFGRTDGQGRPLYALTVAIRKRDLIPAWDGSAIGLASRFVVTAQIRDRAGQIVRDVGELGFGAEPIPDATDPWLRFQAIIAAPVGASAVSAAVLDRVGGAAATANADLNFEVVAEGQPCFAGPMLARRRVDLDRPPAARLEPFRLGPSLLFPSPVARLDPDEPIVIALELLSPAGTSNPVKLSWVVTQLTGPGSPRAIKRGELEDGRGPRAWEFVAGQLPSGAYRVEYVATDPVTGARVDRQLEFEISGPGRS